MDGIIPLYKERGMTSFACVSRLRQILKTKKIGHSGTLDPGVAGVLPICVGNATKVVDYLMQSGKQYQGELLIGFATTTQDLDGDKIEEKVVADEIPTSEIFELLSSKYDEENKQQRIRFNVECSKGTYIRTLVVDLARKLGYPGVMSLLTRLKSGGFTLDQTLSLDDVRDAVATQTLQQYLYPLDYALKDYPQLTIQVAQWKKVQNGGWLSLSELNTSEKEIVLSFDGQVKALYHFDPKNKMYKPTKMFAVN